MANVRFSRNRGNAQGVFTEDDGSTDLTEDVAIVYDAALDTTQLDLMITARTLLEHYEEIGLSNTDTDVRRLVMNRGAGSAGISEEDGESNVLDGEDIGLEINPTIISGASVTDEVDRLIEQIGTMTFPR